MVLFSGCADSDYSNSRGALRNLFDLTVVLYKPVSSDHYPPLTQITSTLRRTKHRVLGWPTSAV